MRKIFFCLNVFLLIIILWQNWRIDDIARDRDYAYDSSEFWHKECAHWKIYGKPSY